MSYSLEKKYTISQDGLISTVNVKVWPQKMTIKKTLHVNCALWNGDFVSIEFEKSLERSKSQPKWGISTSLLCIMRTSTLEGFLKN